MKLVIPLLVCSFTAFSVEATWDGKPDTGPRKHTGTQPKPGAPVIFNLVEDIPSPLGMAENAGKLLVWNEKRYFVFDGKEFSTGANLPAKNLVDGIILARKNSNSPTALFITADHKLVHASGFEYDFKNVNLVLPALDAPGRAFIGTSKVVHQVDLDSDESPEITASYKLEPGELLIASSGNRAVIQKTRDEFKLWNSINSADAKINWTSTGLADNGDIGQVAAQVGPTSYVCFKNSLYFTAGSDVRDNGIKLVSGRFADSICYSFSQSIFLGGPGPTAAVATTNDSALDNNPNIAESLPPYTCSIARAGAYWFAISYDPKTKTNSLHQFKDKLPVRTSSTSPTPAPTEKASKTTVKLADLSEREAPFFSLIGSWRVKVIVSGSKLGVKEIGRAVGTMAINPKGQVVMETISTTAPDAYKNPIPVTVNVAKMWLPSKDGTGPCVNLHFNINSKTEHNIMITLRPGQKCGVGEDEFYSFGGSDDNGIRTIVLLDREE